MVSCPTVGHTVAAEACELCQHLEAVSTTAVQCTPPVVPPERDPREDLRERAIRTQVADLAAPEIVCIRGDASVADATRLLVEHDLRCLPVVDAERKLVGIVSRADLLRESVHERAVLTEIMTPRVHALPEDAPLAYAVALMAESRVHEVPLVTNDGVVVGVFTALDALRWMAEQLGYRLTEPARPTPV
jgi:CBS domain-containing protein